MANRQWRKNTKATYEFGVPELVGNNIYRICIPMPGNPLKVLNSYVVMEGSRPLVIDLGFDMRECYEALTEGLRALDLSWDDVDIFFTHGHPDHCGLVNRVKRPSTTFYAGFGGFYQLLKEYHVHNRGFQEWMSGGYELLPEGCDKPPVTQEERRQILSRSIDYSDMDEVLIPYSDVTPVVLGDGELFMRGSRVFRVIRTSGHSPDHLCLYDERDKILISGDQILARITPVVVSFALGDNVLASYIQSAEKLSKLEVSLCLTGHRDNIDNVSQRVIELVNHHALRGEEVRQVLREGPANVVEIAKGVSWRSPISNWDDWPLKQKYFSLGETISHLSQLEHDGVVTHSVESKGLLFRQV
ncbi:MBL fold metallo-hydrolase [Adlercreutzia sp. ZJ141]|uniref:MBL fold metallo-hydrolase n=1 Tax=Adlercreutzia sp. ZJ141 TaxID=2709406 RepID=UPI0013ECB083|nr:MBL fold metallo-hydrolase [Adlercreutzia sp. ZJ141]